MPSKKLSLLLATTTCGDQASAQALAERLVEARVAACVQITPAAMSVYRWQGHIEAQSEWLLTIKTTRERWPALETVIKAHHPYELPELIAVEAAACSSDYRTWLCDQLSTDSPND